MQVSKFSKISYIIDNVMSRAQSAKRGCAGMHVVVRLCDKVNKVAA